MNSDTSTGGISARLLLLTVNTPVSEVSRLLGLAPDESWDAGAPTTKRIATPLKDHCWMLVSSTDEKMDLEIPVNDVIGRFRPVASRLHLLSERPRVILSCTVEVDPQSLRPAIVFSKDSIQFLGLVGAEVGVDLRFL